MILKYCHGHRSIKVIYHDFKTNFEKTTWDNNPEASYTTEINKHVAYNF